VCGLLQSLDGGRVCLGRAPPVSGGERACSLEELGWHLGRSSRRPAEVTREGELLLRLILLIFSACLTAARRFRAARLTVPAAALSVGALIPALLLLAITLVVGHVASSLYCC
jgi:hypothetical protein